MAEEIGINKIYDAPRDQSSTLVDIERLKIYIPSRCCELNIGAVAFLPASELARISSYYYCYYYLDWRKISKALFHRLYFTFGFRLFTMIKNVFHSSFSISIRFLYSSFCPYSPFRTVRRLCYLCIVVCASFLFRYPLVSTLLYVYMLP